MIHIGSFEIKTEIFVLLVSLLLMSFQLLLCFKVKRLWVRLIPFGLFAGVAAILILGAFFRVYNGLVLFAYATDSGFLALVCACGWAIWWIIDSLVAFIRRSTKKQVVTLFSVIASTVLIVVTSVILFNHTYPTHYPYKDREIIGSTPEEIEAKYGEFWALYRNEENVPTSAEYMIREDYMDFLGNDESLWYHIYFKDGVAVSVRLQKGRPGG
ncbi:MAG: hypothetical protein IKK74_09070 [Clostridia bacterium]|nr:hypothetical protein [Clostridia bacterium]